MFLTPCTSIFIVTSLQTHSFPHPSPLPLGPATARHPTNGTLLNARAIVGRPPGGVRGAPGGLSLASKLSRSGPRTAAPFHISLPVVKCESAAAATRAGSKLCRRRFAAWPVDQLAVKSLVKISAEIEQALVQT